MTVPCLPPALLGPGMTSSWLEVCARFRSPEDLALSKHSLEAALYGVPDAQRLGLMNPGSGKAVGSPTRVPRPLLASSWVFHPRSSKRTQERAAVEPREKVHRKAHKRPSAKPAWRSLSHRAIWGSPRTLSGSFLAVTSMESMSGNSSAFDVLASLTKRANTSGCDAGNVFLLSTLPGAHQNSRPCREHAALAFAQRVRTATRRACPALR